MKNPYNEETFSLENFEGSLDLLLYLVQKQEIELSDVAIQDITKQYLHKLAEIEELKVDVGAEFIGSVSFLLWLKSRMLLPKHEQFLSLEEEELDPRFEIIHQLLDYSRFKDAAKNLSELEASRQSYYRIQDPHLEINRINYGIEHLTIDDLAGIFENALAKAKVEVRTIEDEEWKVADKIKLINQKIKEIAEVEVEPLFSEGRCKDELIVTFLAILELLKIGNLQLIRNSQGKMLLIKNEV